MELPLVFNPRSGPKGKDPDDLLSRVPKALRERVEVAPLVPTFDYRPFIERAAAAGGPLLVWGGDGTIHHAGRALAEVGCPVPLAAIPGGSGNGLVRGLRTPLDPAKALEALLRGRELRMDLPRLDGTPFLNLCGTGFEATVAHEFDKVHGRGFKNYTKLCLRLWRTEPELRLAWNDTKPDGLLPDLAWSLCFANLPQYGSGLWIAPGADPRDGLLQLVKLSRPGIKELITKVLPLFRQHGRTALRCETTISHAQVRLERPMPWHLDGEPVAERDRAELTVEPMAFRMQVTAACPWK
jgi:diacylglycerol kinase family enzyme